MVGGVEDECPAPEDELPGPPLAPLLPPAPAEALLGEAGAGCDACAGGWAAPAESSRLLPEPVPPPSASSASTRPTAAAREVLASEAAGPGPINAPSAIPAASISAARTAPIRREGS